MKIVFFGSPASAIPSLKKLLEKGHEVKLIVCQPDKPAGRGKKLTPCPAKKFALDNCLSYYQPEKIRADREAYEKIKKIEPDIIIIVAYGQIIPSSIIYLPKYNSINIHFSLLPLYRGASPVQWAILNGENKTGLTIFELNEKMDEGDILSQEKIEILPNEKAYELEARLAQRGAELLLDTLSQIDRINRTKQNHAQASYASKMKKDDGRIDWAKDAIHIDRIIRALIPWPSAFTFYKNRRIKIHEGRISGNKINDCRPGQILAIKKEGIMVGCGEGSCYLIEILQPENKNKMSALAFSLGAKINPGEFFT